jgi:hypothetical protein
MAHMLGVYTIVERKSEEHPDRKNLWIHIGVAFINRDGSINVRLNALPLDGKLHIREMSNGEAATEPDDGTFT